MYNETPEEQMIGIYLDNIEPILVYSISIGHIED